MSQTIRGNWDNRHLLWQFAFLQQAAQNYHPAWEWAVWFWTESALHSHTFYSPRGLLFLCSLEVLGAALGVSLTNQSEESIQVRVWALGLHLFHHLGPGDLGRNLPPGPDP